MPHKGDVQNPGIAEFQPLGTYTKDSPDAGRKRSSTCFAAITTQIVRIRTGRRRPHGSLPNRELGAVATIARLPLTGRNPALADRALRRRFNDGSDTPWSRSPVPRAETGFARGWQARVRMPRSTGAGDVLQPTLAEESRSVHRPLENVRRRRLPDALRTTPTRPPFVPAGRSPGGHDPKVWPPAAASYFEPKTRSKSAVSPALWNLMSFASAL